MPSGKQERPAGRERQEVLGSIDPTLRELERYSSYFENGSRSLAGAPDLPLFAGLSGVAKLLGSFSIALLHDLYEEEWNPFSQRQLILNVIPAKNGFALPFQTLEDSLRSLLLSVHEALHIALWEPFFTGRLRVADKETFKSASLCFEACCFWYADLIATPRLRRKFPDNELTFERKAISETYFHPSRAFAALGITEPDRILEVYMAAFCGRGTPLSQPKEIFSFNLAQRIYQFHFAAKAPLHGLYAQLRRAGTFSEFRERFCAVDCVPSLFPDELSASLGSDLDSSGLPFRYCRGVFERGLPFIESLPKRELARVRLRRYIQSRAYFAFVLRKVLKDENFVSLRGAHHGVGTTLLSSTDSYLQKLESALRALCANKTFRGVVEQIDGADRFFSNQVVRKARSQELWVARRTSILPRHARAHLTGLLKTEALSPRRRKQEATRLRKYFARALYRGKPGFDPATVSRFARILPDLLSSSVERPASKRVGSSPLTEKEFIETYNAIAAHPEVIPEWGAPLYGIDPERNQFRDLLFVYV